MDDIISENKEYYYISSRYTWFSKQGYIVWPARCLKFCLSSNTTILLFSNYDAVKAKEKNYMRNV